MAQWVKSPATKHDNLSAIPGTRMMEGENRILKHCPLSDHIHVVYVCVHMHSRADVCTHSK